MGVQVDGERGRRAGGGDPRRPARATAGSSSSRPTEHGASRSPPSTTRACCASSRRRGTTRSRRASVRLPRAGDDPDPRRDGGHVARVRARDARDPTGGPGYWALDTSTYILPGTYAAARAAVDVALTTADLVLGGERAAYGLCRPPGHHAARSMYGGFCYFNNAAIAAQAIARETGEPRRDPRRRLPPRQRHRADLLAPRRRAVRELHAHPDRQYPYFLGWEDETGEGDGRGREPQHPAARRARPTSSTSRRSSAAWRGSPRSRATSSSSRSGSTPTARTRSATSRSRRPSTTSADGGSPRSASGS